MHENSFEWADKAGTESINRRLADLIEQVENHGLLTNEQSQMFVVVSFTRGENDLLVHPDPKKFFERSRIALPSENKLLPLWYSLPGYEPAVNEVMFYLNDSWGNDFGELGEVLHAEQISQHMRVAYAQGFSCAYIRKQGINNDFLFL